jgi:hypothetical protein
MANSWHTDKVKHSEVQELSLVIGDLRLGRSGAGFVSCAGTNAFILSIVPCELFLEYDWNSSRDVNGWEFK